MGVAAVIGLAIFIQLQVAPSAVFFPNVIPFVLAAALVGSGFSWLLGLAAQRSLPSLANMPSERGLYTALISSILASVTEVLFFTYGF